MKKRETGSSQTLHFKVPGLQLQSGNRQSLWQIMSGNYEEDKACKLVTSGTETKAPAPPEDLQQWNRFTVLKAVEEVGVLSNGPSGLTGPNHARPPGGSSKW